MLSLATLPYFFLNNHFFSTLFLNGEDRIKAHKYARPNLPHPRPRTECADLPNLLIFSKPARAPSQPAFKPFPAILSAPYLFFSKPSFLSSCLLSKLSFLSYCLLSKLPFFPSFLYIHPILLSSLLPVFLSSLCSYFVCVAVLFVLLFSCFSL